MMSHIDQDDGCVVLERGEYLHWSGEVTITVRVSFDADDPGDIKSDFDERLEEAIVDAVHEGDYEVSKDACYDLDSEVRDRDD